MTRIALLQMTSGIDPSANAAVLQGAIAAAAGEGARILFTPEMTGLLDRDRTRLAANAQPAARDVTLAAAQSGAQAHGLWVHLGSQPVPQGPGRFANRSYLIAPDGAIAATYDKIHRFDVTLPSGETYRESASYDAGGVAPCVATPLGMLGLTICYDVRFPGLYRALAQAGAEMIAVPAAFTATTGAAHWHTLLRARAIETGAFVVAAAQTGCHADGRTTYGHSLVVSPWGDIQLDMAVAPGVAVVDIDLDAVRTARTQIPAWSLNQPFEVAKL